MKDSKFNSKLLALVVIYLIFVSGFAKADLYYDREVPYIRQTDYAEFGLSACGPSSVAMILQYHFPNAHVSAGQIYHSGTQSYSYDGPIQYYRNVGFQDCTVASLCDKYMISDTGLSVIEEEGRTFYNGTYSGANFTYIENYLKEYWDAKIESVSSNYQAILDALSSGPLLANVNVCGSGGGHYLVVTNIDDNNTAEINDDLIVLNDPEPNCSNYYPTRSGFGKKIGFTTFLNSWVKNGIYKISFPSYSEISKSYSILVDNSHLWADGAYFSHSAPHPLSKYTKYSYNSFTDELDIENTYREEMYQYMAINDESKEDIYYSYNAGKDFFYLKKDNSNDNNAISSVIWHPTLKTQGYYEVSYIFYDYGKIDNLEFKLMNNSDEEVDKTTVTYENSGSTRTIILWSNIYLNSGYYVKIEDVPQDVNIDAIRFKFNDYPVTVQMYNVDDLATLYINDIPLYNAKWGYYGSEPDWYYVSHKQGDSGEIDITSDIEKGKNTLRFTVWNQQVCCYVSLSIYIKRGDDIIFSDSFSMRDSSSGIKYDKSFVISYDTNNKGDVNLDNEITLHDSILALQTLSDQNLSDIHYLYNLSRLDINGDNKLGIEETIYILQVLSGLRATE